MCMATWHQRQIALSLLFDELCTDSAFSAIPQFSANINYLNAFKCNLKSYYNVKLQFEVKIEGLVQTGAATVPLSAPKQFGTIDISKQVNVRSACSVIVAQHNASSH